MIPNKMEAEMPTEQSHATDFSTATRMLDAIVRNDLDMLRRCFAPGALVWHNYDEIEQDIDTVIATALDHLCALSTSRAYEDRRATTVGTHAFLQHTLTVCKTGREVTSRSVV